MLDQFIAQYNGKPGIGDTPENDGQCVGLVEKWLDALGAPHIWGDAFALPANADPSAYVITPNSPSYVPSPGDIGCEPKGWGGSDVGHTFIVAPGTDAEHLVVFEQNDRLGGGDGSCRLYNLGYYGNPTFIHPKVLDQSNQGETEVISADDVKTLYLVLLNRSASDAEAASWAGKSWHDVFYAIKDSPEGQAYYGLTQSEPATIFGLNQKVAALTQELETAQQAQPIPVSVTPPPSQPSPSKPPVSSPSPISTKPNLWEMIKQWLGF